MPPPSSKGPASEAREARYRLPNVLVAHRAGAGVLLAILAAFVWSLGIVRACELESESAGRERPRH